MPSDMMLVQEYANTRSERAFSTLVERHVNLVHASALRQVGDVHLAQEITQAVFIILADKAKSLGPDTILSAWLYRTTRYAAADALKSQRRRVKREQEAYMQSTLLDDQTDPAWAQLSASLDDAMAKLNESDRAIVILRYFENKSAAEVAEALKLSDAAVHKRLSRALEKLRKFFALRGATVTTAIVASAISANSVHAAPVGLVNTITSVVVAKSAATGGSTLTLVKGTLKLMAWTKAKIAIVAAASILLATGTTAIVIQKTTALSATDLSWADNPKYWELDLGDPDPEKAMKTFATRAAIFEKRIEKLPPVLILRPTRFRTKLGSVGSGDKIIGRGQSLASIIGFAYDPMSTSRIILPENFRNKNYDLMLTLPSSPPNNPRAALQEEIKKRFGYVAHLETIETNILILRVDSPIAPALQPTKGGLPSYPMRSTRGQIAIKNQEVNGVAACFSALLKTRVVNQTEIKGRYDVDLQWEQRRGETEGEAIKRTVLDQLGFSFFPSRESFQYLVVQKVD